MDPVVLDGTPSYDENTLDQFSYEWKVVQSPNGSAIVKGSFLSPTATVEIMPDLVGVYVFRLKTSEINTPDLKTSNPTFTTIEVK